MTTEGWDAGSSFEVLARASESARRLAVQQSLVTDPTVEQFYALVGGLCELLSRTRFLIEVLANQVAQHPIRHEVHVVSSEAPLRVVNEVVRALRDSAAELVTVCLTLDRAHLMLGQIEPEASS